MVPHRHNGRSVGTTPLGNHACITGLDLVPHAAHDHACITGLDLVPRSSGITLPRTGNPHNGHSYHALHNGPPAQRAFVLRLHNAPSAQRAVVSFLHNGLLHAARPAQRAFRTPDPPHPKRKGNDDHTATGAERVGIQLPRARWYRLSKANDLAREAVSCNAVFGAPVEDARVASRMRRPPPHGTTPA